MSTPSAEVDAYIADQTPDAQVTLNALRATIRAAAPGAEERIAYRIPVFRLHGDLVSMAAFKSHVSFVVMSTAVADAHRAEFAPYKSNGTTIHFAPGSTPPASLITTLVVARQAENEAAAAAKASTRTRVPRT